MEDRIDSSIEFIPIEDESENIEILQFSARVLF